MPVKNRPTHPTDARLRAIVTPLLADLRSLIDVSRASALATVNATLTTMYWRIGRRIDREVLAGSRASYGAEIVSTLSRQLTLDYGRSFGEKNLRHMLRFSQSFQDEAAMLALAGRLSWSHFLELIYLKEPAARDFYARMCSIECWSVRVLRSRIGSMLFERTALARDPEELIRRELGVLGREGEVSTALVLKDPYVLDFLDLQENYLERDLEAAILRELEGFMLELGTGFSFIARQKRIQIDNEDFHIDLLFYNRRLRRLVVVELKLDEFRAEHKAQMELYLRWLARHDQEPGDRPPLGIILCTSKKREQIELLELDRSGIHVAEYLTVLPPREVFERRVQAALAAARARLPPHPEGGTRP